MSEILDQLKAMQTNLAKIITAVEQSESGDLAEVQVANKFCNDCGAISIDRERYIKLVRQMVDEGWYKYFTLLYLPVLVNNSNKCLNALNPYDRDDAFRGKITKGSPVVTSHGIKLRSNYFDGTEMQVLDEIETYVEVDEMPGYPWVGFGAYIQESASTICMSPAGFIPTIDQNGISHTRICSTYHEQTLPAAHRKPKGLICGQHNSVKKSTDFWHNGELVFSDKTETATAQGTIKIVIGPQYDHPTNYTTLTAFWLFREMPDELLIKMQGAFKQFFTDLKLNV